MKKYNKRKEIFLNCFSDILIEDNADRFIGNIKFSFEYFDNSQAAGQDFSQWNQEQLSKLLIKLKEYSKNTFKYWRTQKIGHIGNSVLAVYESFPVNSEFIHPKHVPIDVQWACFRLEQDMRVAGFFIPNTENYNLDKTTFYIVFLDKDHKFYKTKK